MRIKRENNQKKKKKNFGLGKGLRLSTSLKPETRNSRLYLQIVITYAARVCLIVTS